MKSKREEIKLAVFDLDGTLLDSNEMLQENTIAALRALYDSGVKIMINSGRVPSMVEAYFYEAGIKGIRSCADGAYIADENGKVLYQKTISPDVLTSLGKLFRKSQIRFSLMTERDIYIYGTKGGLQDRFRKYEELAGKYALPFPRLRDSTEENDHEYMPVYKIAVVESEAGELEDKLGFLKDFSEQIEVTRSGPTIIDITASGITKGTAVRLVSQHLGIKKEEICCVGDYDNDVQMFREAGKAVAMGNAPEHVKAAADHITEDHNHGGAAGAIMHYILSQIERRTL